MPRQSHWFALGVSFGLSAFTSNAWTADRAATPDNKAGDYAYAFQDDPLDAGGFGATDPRIVIASRSLRFTLIRPRIAFVAEMLKSVEAL